MREQLRAIGEDVIAVAEDGGDDDVPERGPWGWLATRPLGIQLKVASAAFRALFLPWLPSTSRRVGNNPTTSQDTATTCMAIMAFLVVLFDVWAKRDESS